MPTVHSVTVGPTGDYATLNDAFAALPAVIGTDYAVTNGDLVAADVQLDIGLETFTDTVHADMDASPDSWVTDATRYIRIYALDDHQGELSGAHLHENDGSGEPGIDIRADYTLIEGLLFHTRESAGEDPSVNVRAEHCVISRCIFEIEATLAAHNAGRAVRQRGVSANGVTLRNCVFYAVGSGGHLPEKMLSVAFNPDAADLTFENCTVHGFPAGIDSPRSGVIAKNTVCTGHTSDPWGGVTGAASTNNASETGTSPPGSNDVILAASPYVDQANNDFNLSVGSALVDAGTDLSGTLTTDVTGATRTLPFDIGAYEVPGSFSPDGPATALADSGVDGTGSYIEVYPSDAYSDPDGHPYDFTRIQYSLTSNTGPWTAFTPDLTTRPTLGSPFRIDTADVSATDGDSIYVRTADADDTDGLGSYGTVLETFFPVEAPAPSGPSITTTTLPNGTVGTAYSQTLAASGGAVDTWAVTVGSLPAGLSLNSSTGEISGTPTASGAETFTVSATNTEGSDTQELTLTIDIAAVTGNVTLDGSADSGALVLLLDATTNPATEAGRDTTDVNGDYSITPSAAGTYIVIVEASDGSDAGAAVKVVG